MGFPVDFFTSLWQGGIRSEAIEAVQGRFLEDFPPYGGADHSEWSFSRFHEDNGTLMGVTLQERGQANMLCRHPSLGFLQYSTPGRLESRGTVKIPLGSRSGGKWSSVYGHSLSPFKPLSPVQCIGSSLVSEMPLRECPSAMGEVHLEGVLPHPERQLLVAALHLGPVGLRAVRTPTTAPSDPGDSSSRALQHSSYLEADVCWGFSPTTRAFFGLQVPVEGQQVQDSLALGALETSRLRLMLIRTISSPTRQKTWRELPTMAAASLQLWPERVQAHVASLFEAGHRELEGVLSLNLSRLLSFLPKSVLLLGINDQRRLAVGLTTQLSHSVRVTLGVHKENDKEASFGLHFQC